MSEVDSGSELGGLPIGSNRSARTNELDSLGTQLAQAVRGLVVRVTMVGIRALASDTLALVRLRWLASDLNNNSELSECSSGSLQPLWTTSLGYDG